jgi:hypothetical protein
MSFYICKDGALVIEGPGGWTFDSPNNHPKTTQSRLSRAMSFDTEAEAESFILNPPNFDDSSLMAGHAQRLGKLNNTEIGSGVCLIELDGAIVIEYTESEYEELGY